MSRKTKRKIDLKAQKLERQQLQMGNLIPGRLYALRYDAKYDGNKKKLPIWDRTPLILMLRPKFTLASTGEQYVLGLNLHHPFLRTNKSMKNIFGYVMDEYLKKQVNISKSGKSSYVRGLFDISYKDILVSSAMYQLRFGVRLYLVKNIKTIRIVPKKIYDRVGTKWTTDALRAVWKKSI